MLVTCSGYTGYRNAKFGQIQVHERITETSRELLMQIKELAEDMGFEVLHCIVDCLWVVGEPILVFKEALNGLPKSGILLYPNVTKTLDMRRRSFRMHP
jgi:DNA polymerase I